LACDRLGLAKDGVNEKLKPLPKGAVTVGVVPKEGNLDEAVAAVGVAAAAPNLKPPPTPKLKEDGWVGVTVGGATVGRASAPGFSVSQEGHLITSAELRV